MSTTAPSTIVGVWGVCWCWRSYLGLLGFRGEIERWFCCGSRSCRGTRNHFVQLLTRWLGLCFKKHARIESTSISTKRVEGVVEVGQELEGKHGMIGQWTHLLLLMKSNQTWTKIFLCNRSDGFYGISGGCIGICGGCGREGLLIGWGEEGVLRCRSKKRTINRQVPWTRHGWYQCTVCVF